MKIGLCHTSALHKKLQQKNNTPIFVMPCFSQPAEEREVPIYAKPSAQRERERAGQHCVKTTLQSCLRTAAPGVSKRLLIYFSCYIFQQVLQLVPRPVKIHWICTQGTRSSSEATCRCTLYGICVHTANAGGKHRQQGNPGI